MNQININQTNCTEAISIGGIQAIYYTSRNYLGRYWYYNQTHTLQYAEIIGNSNFNRVKLIQLIYSDDTAAFTQEVNKDISRVYSMSLVVSINHLSKLNRDKLEQLDVAESVVLFFLDMNGHWWLMGETNGCFVNTTYKTETINGRNDQTITFTCSERYPIRSLSTDFVIDYLPTYQLLYTDLGWTVFQTLSWSEYNQYIW